MTTQLLVTKDLVAACILDMLYAFCCARCHFRQHVHEHIMLHHTMVATIKPEIFACPLFRDLDKFAKIMGREYSNGNCLLSTSQAAR